MNRKLLLGPVLVAVPFAVTFGLFQASPPAAFPECAQVEGFAWFVQGALRNSSGTALVLQTCAAKYDQEFPEWALVLYVALYLLLQTFAIPGPLILSLVSGALWPLWKAQAVIMLCATVGASCCYLVSSFLEIGQFLRRANPDRFDQFRAKVLTADKEGKLLYFMMFLRISPMLPNWFVNLVSPVAGVPLRTFAIATAFGLVPANVLHYNTGSQLFQMLSADEKTPAWQNFALLLLLQFLALVPTLFKDRIKYD